MRAAPAVAALVTVALCFGAPARGDDLELELDLDLPTAPTKKKTKKKKSQQKASPADDLALELDLDLEPVAAPRPPRRKSGRDLELELDFEPAPAAKPSRRPARKPAPSLELDLDLEPEPAPRPQPKPKGAGGLELELELELEPEPAPRPRKTPPPAPAGPSVLMVPAAPGFEDPFEEPRLPPEPFHRFDVGLKVGGSLMNALTEAGHAGEVGAPTATRGFTIPAALELRVFPTEALRGVALSFEAGFFPKSGRFKRDLPHDPDFASMTAQWSMLAVPVALGVSWDLPWRALGRRVGFGLRAAVLGQYVRSTTTWSDSSGAVAGSAVSAFAPGWLAGAELNVKLGSGFLVFDVRSAHAFTDLGHAEAFAATGAQAAQPWGGATSGDVQGTTFLLGYRYVP